MAIIMSTADSLINTTSVIFAHDLYKPLQLKWSNNEVLVSKIFAIFSGITSSSVLTVGSGPITVLAD
jgi:Na+/proline symporter